MFREALIKLIKTTFFCVGAFVIIYIMSSVIQFKFQQYKENSQTPEQVSAKETFRQLDCLAKNVYYEASSEPFEGKVAVAQVTINRSKHKEFPSDICRVVHEKNVFFKKVICQFSWFCDQTYKKKPVNHKAYEDSYEVAKKVMIEGFRLDSMKEAIYYHADYVNPHWNKPRVGKIGRHIFYKDT